jgi:hypothetical protein
MNTETQLKKLMLRLLTQQEVPGVEEMAGVVRNVTVMRVL